jgi:hypothetical protein
LQSGCGPSSAWGRREDSYGNRLKRIRDNPDAPLAPAPHDLDMYWDHMDGWWVWMTVWPLVWIVLLGFAVYIAVRLGIRDSKRDQS